MDSHIVQPEAIQIDLPLLPRPPHPVTNPCHGCPRCPSNTSPIILDRTTAQAWWQRQPIGLTVNEFRVIDRLVTEQGRWITYRTLYDALKNRPGFIAGPQGDCSTNIRSAIKRIRRKFKTLDPAFNRIQNMQAVGYQWTTSP